MTQKYLRIILAVLIVIAAPIAYWYAKNQPSSLGNPSVNNILSSEYKVADVGANSFGALTNLTTTNGGKGGDAAVPSTLTAPNQSSAGATGSSGGSSGISGSAKIVPPYYPVEYHFKYKGEDLNDLPSRQFVYKRTPDNVSTGVIDRVISVLSFGLIDLSKFDSTKLQSMAITEDKQFGYSVYADFNQGSINISQNYNQWPQPYQGCSDEACYLSRRLSKNEMLDDNELIDIANQFVTEKNISLDGYGAPLVTNSWQQLYDTTPDKANFYFPETMEVVYPLLLDGRTVFDEGGNASGLHVSVDIRNKKVSGLYDLATKQYQKSAYTGVTDSKQIVSIAEKGGFRSYDNPGVNGAKVVNLELQTPTTQVLRMWKFDGNNSEELFVPALVFPIKNPGTYWRKNVIVPLVKEILDNDQSPVIMYGRGGPADIMPLAKPQTAQ